MKQENTVRNTIVKSIRLTPDECARIEGMAKQSNMSFKAPPHKSHRLENVNE